MELRKCLGLVLAFPLFSFADDIIFLEPTEITESTEVDQFTERASGWKSEKIKRDSHNFENQPISEVLNKNLGVVSRERGSPVISIRGSESISRVQGLYNGIPLNMSDGFGAPRLLFAREVGEELNIIKGPASVFYGTTAVGGAVNLKIRKFDENLIRGGMGSFGLTSILGVSPIVKEKNHHVQLSAYQESFGGNYPFTTIDGATSGIRDRSNESFQRFTLYGSHDLGKWFVQENFVYAREFGANPESLISSTSPNHFRNNAFLGSLSVEHILNNSLTWEIRNSYTRVDNESRTENTGSIFLNTTDRIFSSLSVNHDLSDIVSAKYILDSVYDQTKITSNNLFLVSDHRIELGTSFNILTGPEWKLIPGFRYIPEFSKLIKSIAFTNEDKSSKKWISFSEGYRTPSVVDRFGNTSSFIGNPGLKAEDSTQIEGSFLIKRDSSSPHWYKQISYQATIFSIDYQDFISYKSLSPTQSTLENAGEARTYGFEFDSSMEWRTWTIHAGYAFSDAKNVSKNEPITHTPKHQVRILLTHQIGPLVFELRDTYWLDYYERNFSTNNLENMNWNTVDFGLRTLGFSNFTVKAGVLNLLNESQELTLGYPEPQRRYYASFEYNF